MTAEVDILINPPEESRNLVQDFTRFRDDPVGFLKTLGSHLRGSAWRGYENYIGHELYYKGISTEMNHNVMNSPQLLAKIRQLTKAQVDSEAKIQSFTAAERKAREEQVTEWLSGMANEMYDKMACRFDHKEVLRFMYYVVAQIFSRSYHQGVYCNKDELGMLKNKARELSARGEGLVFMPCHRSHIDYMALHFFCFRVGLSLPIVVAGDNLDFAVIGPMLRQVGAMFIRRSFANDQLYSAVVSSFISCALSQGFNFECFIEGTRSRTGKLLTPKFGILKFILDGLMDGSVKDVHVVPVSTQYDKVVEGETYATELLGKEKQKESFLSFLDARKITSLKMGRVDVRFSQPWSLKGFIFDHLHKEAAAGALVSSTKLLLPTTDFANQQVPTISPSQYNRLLRSLGYRILDDINHASVVMPTSLIGTVLLTYAGQGISKSDLKRRVTWLIVHIVSSGGKVEGKDLILQSEETVEAVIDNALDVLGSDLVGVESKNLLEPVYFAKDPFKLSYYRNQVIHLFVPESIISVALHGKFNETGKLSISTTDVEKNTAFLSSLLSGEFVFGPDGLTENYTKALSRLVAGKVMHVDHEDRVRLANYQIYQNDFETFDFYCYLLWPFVDGYWLVATCLLGLAPLHDEISQHGNNVTTVWVAEKDFINTCQAFGKTIFHQGELAYYEAVNKEMIKDALMQFEKQGVVLFRRSAAGGKSETQISLARDWVPNRYESSETVVPAGRLFEYSEHISLFRNHTPQTKARRRHGGTGTLNQHVIRLASDGLKKVSRIVQTVEQASKLTVDDGDFVTVSKGANVKPKM